MPASVRTIKPPVHMVGIPLFLLTFARSKNTVLKYDKCFSDKNGVGHSGHVYALMLSLIASSTNKFNIHSTAQQILCVCSQF